MAARLRNVLFLLIGSFLIYCAQEVGRGGMAGTADAGSGGSGGSCGCPAPARTTIFDDVVTMTDANPSDPASSTCWGPSWDISQFRQVVIHSASNVSLQVQVKYGKAGFVPVTVSGSDFSIPAGVTTIDAQLGSQLRVASLGPACHDFQNTPPTLTVVGIQ